MKVQAKKDVSELIVGERKHRKKLTKLQIISKRLRGHLLRDKRLIRERKKLCERKRIDGIEITFPKRELFFGERDFSIVKEIIDLTKKNIGEEEKIRQDIKSKFSSLSEDSRDLLRNIERHVHGENIVDKKELELELEAAKTLHSVLDLINKKFELIKKQEQPIKEKKFEELLKIVEEEESINNRLLILIGEILGVESKERKIEHEKRKLMKPIAPSHAKRNTIIIIMLLVVISPLIFKSASNLFAEEQVAMLTRPSLEGSIERELEMMSSDSAIAAYDSLQIKPDDGTVAIMLGLYNKYPNPSKDMVFEGDVVKKTLSDLKIKTGIPIKKLESMSFDGSSIKVSFSEDVEDYVPGTMHAAKLQMSKDSEWRIEKQGESIFLTRTEGNAKIKVNWFAAKAAKAAGIEVKDMVIDNAMVVEYDDKGKRSLYGLVYNKERTDYSIEDQVTKEKVKIESDNIMNFNGIDIVSMGILTVNRGPGFAKAYDIINKGSIKECLINIFNLNLGKWISPTTLSCSIVSSTGEYISYSGSADPYGMPDVVDKSLIALKEQGIIVEEKISTRPVSDDGFPKKEDGSIDWDAMKEGIESNYHYIYKFAG